MIGAIAQVIRTLEITRGIRKVEENTLGLASFLNLIFFPRDLHVALDEM